MPDQALRYKTFKALTLSVARDVIPIVLGMCSQKGATSYDVEAGFQRKWPCILNVFDLCDILHSLTYIQGQFQVGSYQVGTPI